MQYKKISPEIKLKIIDLSECFWFWRNYYSFYSSILGISKNKLENRFPRDAYNKYQATEAILDELEEGGNVDRIKEIISAFYRLEKPFDKDDNPKYEKATETLKEFKELVGKDVIQEEINKKEFRERLEKSKISDSLEIERNNKIEEIKKGFFEYCKETTHGKKQERAFWLEEKFYDLLGLERIEHTRPYRTKYEQIDGHFKFKSFDYLVEIKWTADQVQQSDISIFDGKIETKGQSTRGFLLSISGFSESAICAATKKSPRLIFMDASELLSVLEGRNSFYDVFCTKEDRLVRLGKVYNEK